MILSVSRRTDIPAWYWQWFLNRLDAGFVCVKNPFFPKQVSRINLSPDAVDCIVFWTKNPVNMVSSMKSLEEYHYYTQVTLTAYGKDIEPQVPDKKKVLIPAIQELSAVSDSDCVVWRYDPILITRKYTKDYHIHAFGEIARRLSGYTRRVVISFVDTYHKNQRHLSELGTVAMGQEDANDLAAALASIAKENGMMIQSCAEKLDLSKSSVLPGSCIDSGLIERLIGYKIKGRKDKNQRPECGCIESVDIGAYDTCRSGCRYCYAVRSQELAYVNLGKHDANSPLLCGKLMPEDRVTVRK